MCYIYVCVCAYRHYLKKTKNNIFLDISSVISSALHITVFKKPNIEVRIFDKLITTFKVRFKFSTSRLNASSSESEEASGSNAGTSKIRRLKSAKAMEKRMKCKEGLKWYEVSRSYLNHSRGGIIRKDSGMLLVDDRAHNPSSCYHAFYTD